MGSLENGNKQVNVDEESNNSLRLFLKWFLPLVLPCADIFSCLWGGFPSREATFLIWLEVGSFSFNFLFCICESWRSREDTSCSLSAARFVLCCSSLSTSPICPLSLALSLCVGAFIMDKVRQEKF